MTAAPKLFRADNGFPRLAAGLCAAALSLAAGAYALAGNPPVDIDLSVSNFQLSGAGAPSVTVTVDCSSPPARGSCTIDFRGNTICVETTQGDCNSLGGVFAGIGTLCPDSTAPTGECCTFGSNTTCSIQNADDCTDAGGEYLGDFTGTSSEGVPLCRGSICSDCEARFTLDLLIQRLNPADGSFGPQEDLLSSLAVPSILSGGVSTIQLTDLVTRLAALAPDQRPRNGDRLVLRITPAQGINGDDPDNNSTSADVIMHVDLASFLLDDLNGAGGTISYSVSSDIPAMLQPITVNVSRGAEDLASVLIDDPTDLTIGQHTLVPLPGLVNQLNSLADGSRVADQQVLTAEIDPGFAQLDGSSDLTATHTAAVRIALGAFSFLSVADDTQDRNVRLTLQVQAPARINSFPVNLRRNGLTIGGPVEFADLAGTLLPGNHANAAITSSSFVSILNALADGNRIVHNDLLELRAVPPTGAVADNSDLLSDSQAATVRLDATAFAFESVSDNLASRSPRISYAITSPGRINTFRVNIERFGGPTIGGQIAFDSPLATPLTPGPHPQVLLSSSDFVAALNALPSGQRIRNGDVLTAVLTPVGLVSIQSQNRASAGPASIRIIVSSFNFGACDGSNASFSYQVIAPADINPFTLDLYRDANGNNSFEAAADTRLNAASAPDGITFNGAAVSGDALNTPGSHANISIEGFRPALDALADGQRISNGDTLFAVPVTSGAEVGEDIHQDQVLVSARQDALVNLVLNGATVSTSSTVVVIQTPYTICAPGRVNGFSLRAGSDPDVTQVGLEPLSTPLASRIQSGAELDPGAHDAALTFNRGELLGAPTDNFVATVDLDLNDAGNVLESEELSDNAARFTIAPRVCLNGLALRTVAGETFVDVSYQVTISLVQPFEIEYRLIHAGDTGNGALLVRRTIGSASSTTPLDVGPHTASENLNSLIASVHAEAVRGVREGDQVRVALLPSTEVNQLDPTCGPRTTPIDVDLRNVRVALSFDAGSADNPFRRVFARVDYEVDAPALVGPFELRLVLRGDAGDQVLFRQSVSQSALRRPGNHTIDRLEITDPLTTIGDVAGKSIVARIDAGHDVAESNESNNESDARPYDVDLRAIGLSFPDNDAQRAAPFTVRVRYDVAGNDLLSPFSIQLFAKRPNSDDLVPLQRIDGANRPIGDLRVEKSPLGSAEVDIRVFGPGVNDVPQDSFTVVGRLDSADEVVEISEDNNDVERQVDIQVVAVDSDGDGLTDGEEIAGFFITRYTRTNDPALARRTKCYSSDDDVARFVVGEPESQGDLPNGLFAWTVRVRTDPQNPDTDGDGISDFDEVVTYAIAADPSGRVEGAGPTGSEALIGANDDPNAAGISAIRGSRIVRGKFVAGVRTDPTCNDTDGDGLLDSGDPAPQFDPTLFKVPRGDLTDIELQSRILNFDQDGDGFLEAPDANSDGVPDFTRYNEATIEGLIGLDFSNDGTLRDGFDIGGRVDASVDSAYVKDLGTTPDQAAPPDDPAARPLVPLAANDRDFLAGRFGSYRVGSLASFDSATKQARFAATARVRISASSDTSSARAQANGTGGFIFRAQDAGSQAGPSVVRRGNGIIDQRDEIAVPVSEGTGAEAISTFPVDNCPGALPSTQETSDLNQTVRFNPTQDDRDNDGIGDSCDPDADNDGISNATEQACGGGAAVCGANAVPLLPLTLAGIASGKLLRRRQRRARRG